MQKLILPDWEIDQIFINNKLNLIFPRNRSPIDSLGSIVAVPRAWCYVPCKYPSEPCKYRARSGSGCYHFDNLGVDHHEFTLPCDATMQSLSLSSPTTLPVEECRIFINILRGYITTFGEITPRTCKGWGQPICTHDLLCTNYDNHDCSGCVSTISQAKNWFKRKFELQYPDIEVTPATQLVVFDIEPTFQFGA